MINIIVGKKGSGKTKKLIEIANKVTNETDGAVLCVEKQKISTFRVPHKARLIDVDDFFIDSFDKLYGLISGSIASNYDIKDVFIDSTFRIGGRKPVETYDFINKLRILGEKYGVNFYITLSCDYKEVILDTWRIANEIKAWFLTFLIR